MGCIIMTWVCNTVHGLSETGLLPSTVFRFQMLCEKYLGHTHTHTHTQCVQWSTLGCCTAGQKIAQ